MGQGKRFLCFGALSVLIALVYIQFFYVNHVADDRIYDIGNGSVIRKVDSSNDNNVELNVAQDTGISEKQNFKQRMIKWNIGPCSREYPNRVKPPKGFTEDFDWYKDVLTERQSYFSECIDDLPSSHIDNEMLIEASRMGLHSTVEKLMKEYELDPLYLPSQSETNKRILNAVQEAIKVGDAQTVKVLTGSNNNMVIDSFGRSVTDYIRMAGSPIRPHDAKTILGHDVDDLSSLERESKKKLSDSVNESSQRKISETWNNVTSFSYSDTCDIDVIHGGLSTEVFLKEYYSTGRPFVLRNHAPKEEVELFSKEKMMKSYPPGRKLSVGPTAYPSLSGQESCRSKMSILDIENATKCKEMPNLSMVHAHHPSKKELEDLYHIYDGNAYDKSGGWRMIEEWFGPKSKLGLTWQIFFGGDTSGATLHWHQAAFNILYVGIKEWKLVPPYHRGFTGMSPKIAAKRLEEEYTLSCTQYPGDQIFVPDNWGHLTLNHGFTAGAAVIVIDKATTNLRLKESDIKPENVQNSINGVTERKQPPFLFVHINKTGGTSLIRMLTSKCRSEYVKERWGSNPTHRSFHATAHSYIERYGREAWDNAYTFAVVRHPLARQVSNFFFLVSNCEKNPRRCASDRIIPTSINGVGISKLTDEEKIKAFHEWLRNLYNKHPPDSPEHYLFGSKGHGNEEYKTFSSTQTSWLVDAKGELVVKAIFHLEDLSDDMRKLTEAIPCLASGGSEDVQLIETNVTPHYPDFMLFSKDEWTRKIIKEVFADDFKNFGYEL